VVREKNVCNAGKILRVPPVQFGLIIEVVLKMK